MKTRWPWIAAALAVGVVVLLVWLNRSPPKPAGEVLVAANYPLSGELGFYGEHLRDGMLLAVEEQGEKAAGKATFKFDWGDNKFQPKEAATVLQKQLLGRPAVYTTALKPQVMAVEQEVGREGIPHLAWVLDLDPNPTGTTNNFRTWISFKLEEDVFLAYARERKAKTVAITYVSLPSTETAYAKYLADGLRAAGCTVHLEPYTPGTTDADLKTVAAKLAERKPDLFVVNGFIPEMVSVIRALRAQGAVKDGNTLAALDMLDATDVLTPAEAEGVVVAAPPYLIRPTAAQREWAGRFERRFGRKPSYHSAFAYDAGLTLIDAAARLPVGASRQQWLEAILATDLDGVTGRVRYGPDKSLVTELQPATYRDGRLVPLKD